jgi:hypothetical protein
VIDPDGVAINHSNIARVYRLGYCRSSEEEQKQEEHGQCDVGIEVEVGGRGRAIGFNEQIFGSNEQVAKCGCGLVQKMHLDQETP